MKDPGLFVVSLDFELFWGMTDKVSLEDYRERLDGERQAIPRMLDLFARHGIHATWSTMGMIAFDTKEELFAALPKVRPAYTDSKLSTYEYLARASIGENEAKDPYHFGASLIREISSRPGQTIGSHTFSHYYLAEDGQGSEAFRADLEAASAALSKFGPRPTSLVLPRNQWQEGYRKVAQETGITSYRGNPRYVLYAPRKEGKQNLFIRALRLIDAYLPISGHHIYTRDQMREPELVNVPASRFLRPYSRRLSMLEGVRRWRITAGMTKAAKEGKLFHLWWHPYNMGCDVDENLKTLEHILAHFATLRQRYGMHSMTMEEAAAAVAN